MIETTLPRYLEGTHGFRVFTGSETTPFMTSGYLIRGTDDVEQMNKRANTTYLTYDWHAETQTQSDVADPKELRRRELMKRERAMWRDRR